jgi:glyoxylase-like metal-dependent hydrolase (beta-lactamase superfamily II)
VLVAGFPAEAFGTNCFVVAPGPGEQCVVIDPGIGVTDRLDEVLAQHRLQPAAVLLTHGHLDHTFSVTPVCGARGITAYIHPDDAEMLADPAKGLSTDLTALFGGRLAWTEPEDVAPLCFSGDVLFRDSIGRTDLPGGSLDQMMASLRDKVLTLPDETVVLPGHGPETTIGRERARNPYLREALEAPRKGW